MTETFEDFCNSTLIVMATFNRKQVTEICLKNIEETKRAATLWVYDDHSTQYSLDHLLTIAPDASIKQNPQKLGIESLRIKIQEEALKTSYKYIYHTDNDAYHDPNWLNRLYEIHQTHDGLIGLYNTKHHSEYTISDKGDVIMRTACPGISFFFEQSLIKNVPLRDKRCWDFAFGDCLQPAAISKISYVEHLGAYGIHNPRLDFNRDRAENPTPWLKMERERLLPSLISLKINTDRTFLRV